MSVYRTIGPLVISWFLILLYSLVYRMVSPFYTCAAGLPLPEDCPANHANESLERHQQAFQQDIFEGFDPIACNGNTHGLNKEDYLVVLR